MKKLFSIFAAVLFAGSMMAGSYTITFKEGSGSSDSSTKVSTVADIISDGAANVSAVTASNVYNARAGRGIKLGTSSNPGSLTLTLAEAVKATSLVVNVRKYNDSEKAFTIQGKDFTADDGDAFTEATYTYNTATEITSIELASPKRIYFTTLTVNFEEEGGEEETGCAWDELEWLGGPVEYAEQFKVCVGDPAPASVVNIQQPGFAAELGIYMSFPAAPITSVSLEEGQYAIDGAGIVLYVSALTQKENEITVVANDVEYEFTVYNAKGEEEVEPEIITLDVAYAEAEYLADYEAWQLNLYKDYDEETKIVTYPDLYIGVYAKSATAIAGTYSADDEIAFIEVDVADGQTIEATEYSDLVVTYIEEGVYKYEVTFTGDDENIYIVDVTLGTIAYDEDYNDIELTDGESTAVENTSVNVKVAKRLIDGHITIIKGNTKFNVGGQVIR